MDASDSTPLSSKVVALPARRQVAGAEADEAPSAPLRELSVDDVPLLAFARDADEGVTVHEGVPLGLRVGIAHRPAVWFDSQVLQPETTAEELRAKWGAAPFVVYLYELSDRGKINVPVKQWQVHLEPDSERDIGHEPWPFAQATVVPPGVAKLHREREALRERYGSTTPDPYEAWSLGVDAGAGAPTAPYDRALPAQDRYGRDMGSDPHDEGPDSRGYDERSPRSRRELVERDPDAPPASVYLPPGKQWARTTEGQWLQIDAPGALAAPQRSRLEALLERLSDDPVAALEKIGLAAVALKKVVDIVAPKTEPVADVVARAVAPLAEKIAVAPTRPVAEIIAEERARWEADKQAETLAAQLREVQGQLGQMRNEVRAARAAPPPPPPKTPLEIYQEFEAQAAGLGLVKRTDASSDAKAPSTLEGVGMLLGEVLNSDVGKTVAEAAKPFFDESAALKRAQREALERNLAPQQFVPPPQQFSPTPQQIADQQAAEEWAREQLAQRQQQLAAQRAQQMVEQTIVEPRQGHTHAFTHAAHAAPAIAHPAPSPTPEADDDAGEEHSP